MSGRANGTTMDEQQSKVGNDANVDPPLLDPGVCANQTEIFNQELGLSGDKGKVPVGVADLHKAGRILELDGDAMSLQPLDPAFVAIERLGGWIFTGIALVAGLVGMVFVGFYFGFLTAVTACCAFAFLLLAGLLAWASHVLPQKTYDHASWCLTASGLEIRRGIWWRSQISIPLARVQHTDVYQGPLMRRFGLAKLIVHTAGTENSAIELNGLSFDTARRLRDALVENRGVIDGV